MASERIPCGTCGGDGWTIEPAHDACCDGNCYTCPIPVQVMCETCGGDGYVLVEASDGK